MASIQILDLALCCCSSVCGVDIAQQAVSDSANAGARNEQSEIAAVASHRAQHDGFVPLLKEESIGGERLLELAGHIERGNRHAR